MKKKKNDSGPSRRTGRGPRDSRSAILESAFRLFSEHGFHGTTTKEIAKAAGLSEGLIFHHFESKVGVLVALLEDILAGTKESVAHLPALQGAAAQADIEEVLKLGFDVVEGASRRGRFRDIIRLLLNSMMALPEREKQIFVRRIHDTLWFPLTETLSRYVKGSDIDPYIYFRMIQGTFMGYVLFQEVLGWKQIIPLDPKKYRDTAASVLAGALRPCARGAVARAKRGQQEPKRSERGPSERRSRS